MRTKIKFTDMNTNRVYDLIRIRTIYRLVDYATEAIDNPVCMMYTMHIGEYGLKLLMQKLKRICPEILFAYCYEVTTMESQLKEKGRVHCHIFFFFNAKHQQIITNIINDLWGWNGVYASRDSMSQKTRVHDLSDSYRIKGCLRHIRYLAKEGSQTRVAKAWGFRQLFGHSRISTAYPYPADIPNSVTVSESSRLTAG